MRNFSRRLSQANIIHSFSSIIKCHSHRFGTDITANKRVVTLKWQPVKTDCGPRCVRDLLSGPRERCTREQTAKAHTVANQALTHTTIHTPARLNAKMQGKKVVHFTVNMKLWLVKQRIINVKRTIYDNYPFNHGINLHTKTKHFKIKFTPDVRLMDMYKK